MFFDTSPEITKFNFPYNHHPVEYYLLSVAGENFHRKDRREGSFFTHSGACWQPLMITFITLHQVITYQKVQTALFEFETVTGMSSRPDQKVDEFRSISRISSSPIWVRGGVVFHILACKNHTKIMQLCAHDRIWMKY